MVHEVLGSSGDATVLDYIVSCLQVGGSLSLRSLERRSITDATPLSVSVQDDDFDWEETYDVFGPMLVSSYNNSREFAGGFVAAGHGGWSCVVQHRARDLGIKVHCLSRTMCYLLSAGPLRVLHSFMQ